MDLSSSREVNSRLKLHEIYRFLWDQNLHRFHNSLPLDPIMNYTNPDHILKLCFFKIHFNIILPSTLRYPKWSP
jgi:hypothetical protein